VTTNAKYDKSSQSSETEISVEEVLYFYNVVAKAKTSAMVPSKISKSACKVID